MTQSELSTNEKVKLVAEWMGLKYHNHVSYGTWELKNGNHVFEHTLHYNSDWNELHEAWKKLYWKMMKEYPITGFGIKEKFGEACIKSDISAAFECLVEGIQLINKK